MLLGHQGSWTLTDIVTITGVHLTILRGCPAALGKGESPIEGPGDPALLLGERLCV